MNRVQVLSTRPWGHPFPLISWLIRLVEWSPQSHIVWYFPEQKVVRHAHFNEIKEQDIDSFMRKNRLVNMKTIYLNDDEFIALNEVTERKIGKQSGYFSTLFGAFIPQLARTIFGVKLRNHFADGFTCSEFVRMGLKRISPFTMEKYESISFGNFTTDDALEAATLVAREK